MRNIVSPAIHESYGWNQFCADPASFVDRCLADRGCSKCAPGAGLGGERSGRLHERDKKACTYALVAAWAGRRGCSVRTLRAQHALPTLHPLSLIHWHPNRCRKGANCVYTHIQPQADCILAPGGGWAVDFVGWAPLACWGLPCPAGLVQAVL